MSNIWNEVQPENKRKLVYDILEKLNGTSDMDWSEICEKYKLSVHADSLRKAAPGISLAYEAGFLDPSPVANESANDSPEVSAQDIETAKVLRREALAKMLEARRADAIRELIRDAAQKLEPYRIPEEVPFRTLGKTLVVVLGDPHYGAEWEVKGLRGEVINRYDPEVFQQRMTTLLSEVKGILRKEDIDNVQLLFAGDCLDGMLRPSQLMSLRYGVVDSCMAFSEYMAGWISQL